MDHGRWSLEIGFERGNSKVEVRQKSAEIGRASCRERV